MLRAYQRHLLITLLCSCTVSAADQAQVDVKQLAGAIKLLQLQLKQTAETVDHISALLSTSEVSNPAQEDLLESVQKLKLASARAASSVPTSPGEVAYHKQTFVTITVSASAMMLRSCGQHSNHLPARCLQ